VLADLRVWYAPLIAPVVDRLLANPWVVAYDVEYIRTRLRLEAGRICMAKAAIVLLADTETKEGLGRMSNALTTVREFKGRARK
jgi:hypothetical protein